jgi:hypothetical protein
MEEDELQITTRTAEDPRFSLIDIRVPPECVMRDKNGKVFVDPEFIKMIKESMKSGGLHEYGMEITELRETHKSGKRKILK